MNERTVACTLASLLSEFALEAVRVQEALDQAYRDTTARHGHSAPSADPGGLRHEGLRPPVHKVREFAVEVRCELGKDLRAAGQITVRPINLGYEIAYGRSATDSSRIHLTMTQVAAGTGTVT